MASAAGPVYARSRTGTGRVRRLLTCCVIALVAAGCRDGLVMPPPPEPADELLIRESPSPFREVSAGSVTAFLPDAWQPRLAGEIDDLRQGILAGPGPDAWHQGGAPPVEGYAATWVDVTDVGVPSDYYYLAAAGPVLGQIRGSSDCTPTRERVIADHRPEFAAGEPGSPGDYVATGRGTCSAGRESMRWAYFVAAPGYGPVREIGIPTSGLYVVVALVPDSPRAEKVLGRMLQRTTFGDTTVAELMAAAMPTPEPAIRPI